MPAISAATLERLASDHYINVRMVVAAHPRSPQQVLGSNGRDLAPQVRSQLPPLDPSGLPCPLPQTLVLKEPSGIEHDLWTHSANAYAARELKRQEKAQLDLALGL